MPTGLVISKAASLEAGQIVLFGFKADLRTQLEELFPEEKDAQLLAAILTRVNPSAHATGSATATLPARGQYPYIKVDLVALPTAASRYNCKVQFRKSLGDPY
jgi:hypothetical protein